jgi:phage-related tail protein
MIKNEIDLFEKVQTQLENIYDEISLLSKKSQNDVLNSFKLKLINKVIVDANSLLKASYKPFDEFDIFKEEELPTVMRVVS